MLKSKRGLVFEMDDGGIYALDADAGAREFLGQRVAVEGIRNGFDRLDVEWIGEAPLTPAP
ncbi:MAG: DUF5818 domain-containing protein [Pseudomonadota bacterium]